MVVDISAATINISLVVLLLENFQVSCEIVRVSQPQAVLSSTIYLAEYSLSHSESLLDNYYLDLKIHSLFGWSILRIWYLGFCRGFANIEIFQILRYFNISKISNIEILKYWNISNIKIFQYFNISIFQIFK